jgi:hypothetical protein
MPLEKTPAGQGGIGKQRRKILFPVLVLLSCMMEACITETHEKRRAKMRAVLMRMMLGFFLVILGPLPSFAQILGLEGPITRVLPGRNEVEVMGTRVIVPPGTPITTPSVNLTELAGTTNPLLLLLGDPLPGRTEPGFMGGTAIINGAVNPDGTLTATDFFTEPAENVLIGNVTVSACTNSVCAGAGNTLRINGVRMVPIRDPRLRFKPITNDFGFRVNLVGANVAGNAAAAEGYFASGRFWYFLMEITGAPLLNPTQTEVSILRAQCRNDPDGIQLDVLGGVHNPATGAVTISDTDNGTVFGQQNAVVAAGEFGSYTFRLRNAVGFQTCPTSVTAQFGGASATSDVDVR